MNKRPIDKTKNQTSIVHIVNFSANGVITERINTFIARILNPSITINRETIGTDANNLNG